MRVLVGVDSYGHVGWNVCDTQCCHRPPLLDGLVVGSRARGHYCDGALTSLLSGHCSLGAVFLTVVADPRATDRNKGTRPVFRGVNPVAATTGGIFAVFRIDALPAPPTPPCHRGGHRFSRNSAAAAPVQVDCGRRLNSLTAIAQPIYQHAHGPGTVRRLGSKIKARRHTPNVLRTHGT